MRKYLAANTPFSESHIPKLHQIASFQDIAIAATPQIRLQNGTSHQGSPSDIHPRPGIDPSKNDPLAHSLQHEDPLHHTCSFRVELPKLASTWSHDHEVGGVCRAYPNSGSPCLGSEDSSSHGSHFPLGAARCRPRISDGARAPAGDVEHPKHFVA